MGGPRDYPSVAGIISGKPVSTTVPAAGNSLVYNAATGQWQAGRFPQRIGWVTTPGAAGVDGTLVDMVGTNPQWVAGDIVDVVEILDATAQQGDDISAAFYGTIFNHSGTPAIKQKRALTADEQGHGCIVHGSAVVPVT